MTAETKKLQDEQAKLHAQTTQQIYEDVSRTLKEENKRTNRIYKQEIETKYQDKLNSKSTVEESKPELIIDSIVKQTENTNLYREPRRRTLAVVPPIPESPMCYCRREVKNIENSVICANGLDNCP